MSIRIASYNLENLFTRPLAMAEGMTHGQEAIDDHALANSIIAKSEYTTADKATLLALDDKYHFSSLNPPSNSLVFLNKVRGSLFGRRNGVLLVVADGRSDWTGWFELRRHDVGWEAVKNTGKVIEAVNPDILVCIEVEDRPTLQRFNEQVLRSVFKLNFPHSMVIDGNDMRGIDVGILSKYPVIGVRPHVDDVLAGQRIFSRDCPEYDIQLPSGELLVVCPNHFKSKRGGNDIKSQQRRNIQGETAAKIVRKAEKEISPFVILAGDLNDTPDSAAIQVLLQDNWQDIQSHPSYPKDRPGTYATGLAGNKIDYIISSPSLNPKILATGIERRGSYHPTLWTSFDGVTRTTEASDHHCIWVDLDF